MVVVIMVMVTVVIMIMVMVMVVIMVMVMVVIMIVMVAPAGVSVCVKLLDTDLLLRHLGKLGDKVDHLVLKEGRPDLGKRLRIVAVEIVDLLLLTGKLPHALEQRAVHLVVRDFDLVAAA